MGSLHSVVALLLLNAERAREREESETLERLKHEQTTPQGDVCSPLSFSIWPKEFINIDIGIFSKYIRKQLHVISTQS